MTLNVELKLGLLITSENMAMSTQASNDGVGGANKKNSAITVSRIKESQ